MSNQAAVHKAFLLVVEELQERYGGDSHGLLSGFLSVVDSMADETRTKNSNPPRPLFRTNPTVEEKKTDKPASPSRQKKNPAKESGLVSFADMLRSGRDSPDPMPVDRPGANNSRKSSYDVTKDGNRLNAKPTTVPRSDSFEDKEKPELPKEDVLIEVKPLPKIRLSLMPSPREEDEDNSSSGSPVPSRPSRKKKSSSSRSKRSRSKKTSNKIK